MKTTVSAIALMAFFAVSPASATDLKGDPTSADYRAPSSHEFRGFYVGVGVGGEFTNNEIESKYFTFDGIGGDGLVGSAIIGYDFRLGSVLIGPYIEGLLTNAAIELNGSDVVSHDYSVIGGLRAGAVVWHSLLYTKLGHEWGFQSSDLSSAENDFTALNFGGGIETYIADNVTLAGEGVYVMGLGDHEHGEGLRALVRLNWRQ